MVNIYMILVSYAKPGRTGPQNFGPGPKPAPKSSFWPDPITALEIGKFIFQYIFNGHEPERVEDEVCLSQSVPLENL